MGELLDLYCERQGPGFWAEPWNALTNAVFLVAAFAAWRSAKLREGLTGEIWLMIALAATVGVGSFLFHTFATVWAMYLDIVPILLFQMAFIWIYSRRQMGFGPLTGGLLLAGLLACSLPLLVFKYVLNGSLTYIPAWGLLVVFAAYHIRQSKNQAWQLMLAAILLLLALVFRTIDNAVCGTFPRGTHFLWHLTNGCVFFLVIESLIQNPWKVGESHLLPIEPASV